MSVAAVQDAYPYLPYPGFTDPEDWRGQRADEGARDDPRLDIVCRDASADHQRKHARRDHPWCAECAIRRDRFFEWDGEPLQSPSEAGSQVARVLALHGFETGDRNVVAAHKVVRQKIEAVGAVDSTGVEQLAHNYELPTDAVVALVDYAVAMSDWDDAYKDARTATRHRARRYLTLHRHPPADTFDPEKDALSLADEMLDLEQLAQLAPPQPLIGDAVPTRSVVILGGRKATFKSGVAVDWAACIASGKPWQGEPVVQGRVLYVAAEGAHGLSKRVQAWQYAWRQPLSKGDFITYPKPVNLAKRPDLVQELVDYVAAGGFRFVVLDTLHKMSTGADANQTQDMGPVLDGADRIKRATDAGSVLIVAHTDATDSKIRGSTAVEDDPDVIFRTEVRSAGVIRLWRDKNKDGPEHYERVLQLRQIDLGHDADGHPVTSFVLESHADVEFVHDATDNELAVLTTMLEGFSENGGKALDILAASGLPKSSFYRALNKLVRDGRVDNIGTRKSPHYVLAAGPVSTSLTGQSQPVSAAEASDSRSQSQQSHPVSTSLTGQSHESHTPIGVGRGTAVQTEPAEVAS